MRIHRLEFEGIGSYPDKHVIDIDQLGASNIFVIEGDTGTGKTTIIDAITLALYGTVAGDNSKASQRIRCDYLPEEVAATATVDFSTSSGIYRVTRRPQQTRPSGKIYTADAALWQLDYPGQEDPGDSFARKVSDVQHEIYRLVGLDREQFLQTVILPQGDFAAFIEANSDERQEILERIFGTGFYSDFQDRIADMTRELTKKGQKKLDTLATVQQQYASMLSTLDIAGRTELKQQLEDLVNHADPDKFHTIVDTVNTHVDKHLSTLKHDSEVADAAVATAQEKLTTGRTVAQQRHDYHQAVIQQERLDERRPDIDATKATVDTARRAARVNDAYVTMATAVSELLYGYQQYSTALAPLNEDDAATCRIPDHTMTLKATPDLTIDDAWHVPQEHIQQLTTQHHNNEQLLGKLDEFKELEREYSANKRHRDDNESRKQQLTNRKKYVTSQLQEMPKKFTDANNDLADAKQQRQHATQLHTTREHNAPLLRAAHTWMVLSDKCHTATQRLEQQQATLQTALTVEADVRHRYQASAAGLLAQHLTSGEPCPVCGSPDHPHPAASADGEVTHSQYRTAADNLISAKTAVETTGEQINTYRKDMDALSQQFGQRTAQQIIDADDDMRRQLEQLHDVDERITTLEQRLDSLREEEKPLRDTLTTLNEEIIKNDTAIHQLDKQIDAAKQRIDVARAGFDSIRDRRADIFNTNSHLADVIDQAHNVTTRLATLDKAIRAAQKEADEQGFSSLSAALDAVIADSDIQAMEEKITTYGKQVYLVTQQLNDKALIAAAQEQEPDIEALTHQVASATAQAKACSDTYATYDAHVSTLRGYEKTLTGIIDDYQQLIQQQEPLWHINELVNAKGGNITKTPLATWVLQSRLDDVLEMANPLVEKLSDGKYRLLRSDSDGSRNKNQGLSLAIYDMQIDKPRSIKTISGGERFYCSLALALALSKVVATEAGGVTIDTMFIDEGFGTLDHEKLDMLLGELTGPDYASRTIGIISHVDAVRERFSERISVTKKTDGNGSTLTIHA